jgi:outer membrane murein-binding lipoprotein Lpp
MRKAGNLWIAALVASGTLVSGCVANNYCGKRQECNNDLEDDSYAVCVESYNSGINALRANKEQECQDLAAAQLAFDACRAALDCDDFEEGDLGGQCDDELDDYEDAIRDAEGECSSYD